LHIYRVEGIIRQLLRAFGVFSLMTLQLLQQVLKTDLEIYALLRQIQNSIPCKPTLMMQDTIHFTDVLGRTQTLHYQWFKHWEVFESMLKCEFKGLPGEERVRLGQYHILNSKRKGFIIDRGRWEKSVFPGSEVNMSIGETGSLPGDNNGRVKWLVKALTSATWIIPQCPIKLGH